jgi:hypothetical protein
MEAGEGEGTPVGEGRRRGHAGGVTGAAVGGGRSGWEGGDRVRERGARELLNPRCTAP